MELLVRSGHDVGFVCGTRIDKENIVTPWKIVVGNESQP